MSLFRSKYGKSSSNSRAVIQRLMNGDVHASSNTKRCLREKQLSATTQRSNSTEGTFYDNDNNTSNNDRKEDGGWDEVLVPSFSKEDDEIEFFAQPEIRSRLARSFTNRTVGPVIRARWRRRCDSLVEDPSTVTTATIGATGRDHHCDTFSSRPSEKMDWKRIDRNGQNDDTLASVAVRPTTTRKESIWMVIPADPERRDEEEDGRYRYATEELSGEEIEVLRRKSMNHPISNNSSDQPSSFSSRGSSKSRRSFFRRTNLFGS